jgi:hypothetical protein
MFGELSNTVPETSRLYSFRRSRFRAVRRDSRGSLPEERPWVDPSRLFSEAARDNDARSQRQSIA